MRLLLLLLHLVDELHFTFGQLVRLRWSQVVQYIFEQVVRLSGTFWQRLRAVSHLGWRRVVLFELIGKERRDRHELIAAI